MNQSTFVFLVLFIIGVLLRPFYNVFLHPLRNYPGPFLCRATFLKWMLVQCQGESNNYLQAMHRKYGHVVRIEPNVLSFIDGQAWPDIYGHKTGHRTGSAAGEMARGNLPKSSYGVRTNANGYADIINAPTEADHRRMRRLMNHMFSASAIAGQLPIIRKYVDILIARLHARAALGEQVDIVMWYNYTTFDILGQLAFGQDFGCLQDGEFHPWVSNIFGSLKDSFLERTLDRFPWPLNKIIYYLWVPRNLTMARKNEFDFATIRAKDRIARGITMEKHDFMSYMLKYNDEKGMSEAAIYLSGITYHLMLNPRVMKKLTHLVRSTFTREDDITPNPVTELEYLTAVLKEGGRTYPPVPSGLPRQATEGGSSIVGQVVPEGTVVYVHPMSINLSPNNFADPLEFVPERWLKDPPAKYANDNLEATQPFSVGPKSCIGRNLAMAEMRLILARMVWNFDLELCDESRGWKESQLVFNVWEKKPLKVKVTSRWGAG
ncbi:hypothetical protein DL766_003476 [Monosporascus sp. MC13-8B]|uniref:Cytochrome P450 n=1 Tax=Monosporascus cannonballus TaxID=155416 RepID=A0ABY0HEA7_9PEZI|nr:hypothetical protein DL763_008398 [Monosporascus cannonballus]RYO91519.1 hypothetical protein DL762_002133 [Monosporascus cannonballus]RYP33413.1 hypothetical protein DL766_003476 [Monosporascus sp. MC13-8B]